MSIATKVLDMDTDRVGNLLFRLTLPQMTVSVITVLVGFISGTIIAGLDIDQFTAYAVSNIITVSLFYAFINGFSIASASIISRNFTNGEKINRIILNGLLLILSFFLLFAVVCLIIAKPFMLLYFHKESIICAGRMYILLSLIPNFIGCFSGFFLRILQGLGEMVWTSACQIITVPATILLNILLISRFGLGGIIITQVIINSFTTVFTFILLRKRGFLKYDRHFADKIIIKNISKLAFPLFLVTGFAIILMSGYDVILSAVNESYVTIMKFFYNWNSINQATLLSASLMPIIGFNISVGKPERVYRTIRYALVFTFISALGFTLFYLFFPKICLEVFSCPDELMAIAQNIFRIASLYVFPMSMVSVINNICTALGNSKIGMYALIIQTVLTLLGGAIMVQFKGIQVIFAFSIAEILTFLSVISIIFFSKNESYSILIKSFKRCNRYE